MADARALETFARLVDVMARLRGPGGCPWDLEQTPETLRPYILEEAYEVIEAIDHGDAAKIRDELGWQPSVTLDEGLRRTVRWYLDNRDWWQAIQARGHKLERLGLKQANG